MKETGFTEQQVANILRQVDEGASVAETCRKAGISIETYYRWHKRYRGLMPAEMTRLHVLEDENARLKRVVAKLIVDNNTTQPAGLIPADEPEPSMRVVSPAEAVALAKRSVEQTFVGADGLLLHLRKLALQLGARLRNGGRAVLLSLRSELHQAKENPGGYGGAVARTVADWIGQNGRELRWEHIRAMGARLAGRARRASKGREALIAGVTAGMMAGFIYGIYATPGLDTNAATVPVDLSVRLNSYSAASRILGDGWDRPQPWGTWMSGNSAAIRMGFDGPARGDVELLLEARTQPVAGIEPPTVIVGFNDTELGRWRMPAQARQLRRRFIVPAAVFNRSPEARLTFDIPAEGPTPTVFGIEALSLRDARYLTNFKGFVDSCSGGELVGWAIAGDTGVSVVASVNGEPIKAVLSTVERPDLKTLGFPDDAGFELRPEQPIAAGSKVEVRFANGRPLKGSPCRP